jgi:hypothetical protein
LTWRLSSLETFSGLEKGFKSAHHVPAKIGFAMEDGILNKQKKPKNFSVF